MRGIDFIDFNNLLLIESDKLNSPITVLYYQYYDDIELLNQEFKKNDNNIQCVVSEDIRINKSIKFGHSQKPNLYDFPDGIDVMEFILKN